MIRYSPIDKPASPAAAATEIRSPFEEPPAPERSAPIGPELVLEPTEENAPKAGRARGAKKRKAQTPDEGRPQLKLEEAP